MSGLPFFARALFDYDAVESTELSLTTGDCVIIEEVNESGWSLARVKDSERVGWIPTEYIEKVDSAGTAVHGTNAEISVERPQPDPCSGSQAIQLSPSKESSLTVTADNPPAEDVEEEVAALRITTAQPVPAPSPAPGPTPQLLPTTSLAASLSAVLPPAVPSSPLTPQPAASTALPAGVSAGAAGAVKVCAGCHEPIKSAFVMARDQLFHPNHFLCVTCSKPLGGKAYLEKDGKFYCETDYYTQFNPKCGCCNETIHGPYVSALDQAFHPHHFTCAHCHQPFPDNHYRQHEGKAYCEEHFAALFAPQCTTCHLPVVGAVFEALGHKYHLACFVCVEGGHPIGEGVMFHMHEGAVYCPEHFEKKFLQVCVACNRAIKGQYIRVGDDFYHSDCWACALCSTTLRVDNCAQHDGRFYCKTCLVEVRQQQQPLALLQSIQSSAQTSRVPSNVATPLPAPATATVSNQPSPLVLPGVPSADVVPLTPAPAAAEEAAKALPTGAVYTEPEAMDGVSYDVLKNAELRPKEVDPKRKELYLSDEEFTKLFLLSKIEFNALPLWKRSERKKQLGLF